MKAIALIALMTTLATAVVSADDKVGFKKDDVAGTVLERQIGQKVEIRLKSGDKISGKVESVGGAALHLSTITGQEYYDAVVILDDISAIVIRTDRK
ncbi:hypothetical protein [Verrucomicrobium spinosum]|uniref:hypothetical protein n=1 Tax=Verrucomicrobium spinosum TaxID=2736 RepID=UPI0001744ED0|nr:hypothetical protein [Verrucomicrobium spinosum]